MVTLVSGRELLQQGGEAAFLQPLVPANRAILSPRFAPAPSCRSSEPRTELGHALRHGLSPRKRCGAGDGQGHPVPAAGGHSPFQVGGDPHIGHLPAHSCKGREDNQALPIKGQPPSTGQRPGRWAPWHAAKRQEGKPGLLPLSRDRRGLRNLMGGRSLYLPCQSRGCFRLSTGRPSAGRCSI